MATRDHSFPVCIPCPVCKGKMEVVYDRLNQQVCVCTECHSGLTIPADAWEIKKAKYRNQPKAEL